MSSEQLADGVNPLDAELAATWDVLKGYSGRDTDLGIARRFGGSSAAYSLRDIGAMNGKVVRVRREPNDTTASIDDEENFSANQISSGALENWVNGKLEDTLPADVDTAAAAYSLRKVKKTYSSNAVRIRRTSDDAEVNVALDSNNKVSTSSSISVVSGSTSATDLDGFLNEVLTVGVAVEGGSGTDRPDSFTNATNSSFTATVTDIAGGYFPYKTNAGDAVTVSFDLVISAGASPSLNTSLGVSSVATKAVGTGYTSSGSYTFTLNCNAEADHIRFADGDDGTFAITNFRVTSHTHQAFVHTWYDQAGSNNAVQGTDANQPKIAENGALLADGLFFDGTNDFLQTSTQVLTGTETGANSMYVVLKQTTGDAGYICGSAANQSGSDFVGQSLYGINADSVFVLSNGNNIDEPERDNITITQNSTVLVSSNYSNNNTDTLNKNANNDGYANGTSAYDFNAGNLFTIGARDGSTATAVLFNGSMKEIIAYDSDQTDNRFKIESNINNYYGLYNDANDLTQTEWQNTGAESFSSTSTDGFSYSNSSSTAFIGVTLSETLAFGDSVFISFKASGVTHPASSDQSPQVRLRDSVSGGDGASPVNEVVNGFNSYTLTYNVAGKSNGDNIVFSEGDTAGGTVTISDFKVSRIARNGFVETWYDQSGNGFDTTQTTATEQPSIVKNGGTVKVNGKPAIDFDGVDNYFDLPTNLNFNLDPSSATRPVNTIMFVGQNDAGNRSFLGTLGSTKNWIGNPYAGRYQFRDNGSNIYDTDTTATTGSQAVTSFQCPSEDNFTIRENGSALSLGGTNNITANISINDIGAGYTGNYQTMKAQEFYFNNERLTDDIVDIENDAINYYNI